MPVQHKVSTFIQKQWTGCCFDCGQDVTQASPEAVWTIWTATLYYCSACVLQDVTAHAVSPSSALSFPDAA